MDWNILGHEWAAQLLRQHIAQNQVRHAYLITGPAGVGRRTLALRFAQALCCSQPPAPGEPCGTCRNCVLIARQGHPDIQIVQSEVDSSTLKVEQIRELQHTLSLSPYESRYRIAILLRFQEANASAQNALLKTLEEAPEKAILLLTADSAEQLLPTIVSRCEILRLRPLAQSILSNALQKYWKLDIEEAGYLSHLSGGRTGYALFLHDHPEILAQYEEWADDVPRLLSASRRERFAYAETAAKDKDHLHQMFQVWLSFWRDLLILCAGSNGPLVHINRTDELKQLTGHLDRQTIRKCASDLELAIERMDANLNSRLLTEVVLLDWPKIDF
jgi:DNA polymerase III subunit delta'